jgi:acetyl-CoA carboxylase carboxyltransferase component
VSVAVQTVASVAGLAEGRLELLLDPGSLRPLRSGVGDGVLAGSGSVCGRPVFAWAQDATVHGGALGARGGETIAHTIRRASAAGAPVVGFPHSGGARLQEGAAALAAYGAIFRAQALARVPQISVVAGPCAGGAAYSPALGDFVIMAGPGALMFLTGPGVVAQVTRERIGAAELGGPRVHRANGVAQLIAEDELQAGDFARALLGHLPQREGGALPLVPPRPPRPGDPRDVLPARAREVYDVRGVIARIVDGGELLELAGRWARNLVCGLGRLDGSPVGVLANQPRFLGGTLDAAAAEKGAWFVSLCERFGIPLVVLVDTPGFLPGATQERDGVIRHGAAFLRAFGKATVPRVTVTLRQAYGGAHIVMNSRDLGADHTLAWDGSLIGVMGPSQAVALIERRAIAAGADVAALAAVYAEEHLPAERAASAGLVDEVIAPADTRDRLLAVLRSVA